MKFLLSVLLFCGLAYVSNGQASVPHFKLIIDMNCSVWGDPTLTRLIIETKNKRGTITLIDFNPTSAYKKSKSLHIDDFESLAQFMSSYDFAYQENMSQGDGSYIIWTDGVSTVGSFYQAGVTKKFNFNPPYKPNQNTQLGMILFKLMYTAFKNKKTIKYIKGVSNSFSLPYDYK